VTRQWPVRALRCNMFYITYSLCYQQSYSAKTQWLTDFSTHIIQCVKVGLHHSRFIPVISGVPQGSFLRHLLFIIYINDLADVFGPSLTVGLFADDVKIYIIIGDINSSELLHDCLNALSRCMCIKRSSEPRPRNRIVGNIYILDSQSRSIDQVFCPSVGLAVGGQL
jgi:hypothetical protein